MWLCPPFAGLSAGSVKLSGRIRETCAPLPEVPEDQHPFAASSESALRIMRNPRLPEIGPNTSGGYGQPPCCLACIGDIGGANGQ